MKNFVTMSLCVAGVLLVLTGCKKDTPKAAGMQGFPVQTVTVADANVPVSSDYVATVKSRRSATLQPQVSGRLTGISAHSGEAVKAGQLLMEIDPAQQLATVESQKATERQKKAVFDFNKIEYDRQQKLFDAGATSRDAFDQAKQSYDNSKSDYESAVELTKTQEEQLAYFRIRAPFDGIVGDIPVHMGDYVSATTILTTVDENKDLEAYIYLPTERAADAHTGLDVELLDTNDSSHRENKNQLHLSAVDNLFRAVLRQGPRFSSSLDHLRTSQLIKARVIWRSSSLPTVPVLAIVRQGGRELCLRSAHAKRRV